MYRPACCLVLACLAAQAQDSSVFRYSQGRVAVIAGSETVAVSPPEGLWSIACEWRDRWPADWRHAQPVRQIRSGEWTLLSGELEACGGKWLLEDAYRGEHGAIRGVRRFTWKGTQAARRVTLSIRFQASADRAQVLLPGIIYYGNPSGARSGRVPVYEGKPGEQAFFEEHRYPMPFACAELYRGGRLWGAALHATPSAAPHGHLPDQWWSLGVEGLSRGIELALLSGPTASNGEKSVIKAYQSRFAPYDEAWLDVPPGAVIEKEFYLEAFPVAAEGAGFSHPLRTALEIFAPFSAEGMPRIGDIVRAKYEYAKTRWREGSSYCSFQKYPDRPMIVMGWCGQADSASYALLVLAEGLRDPRALEMARRSLDFLSGAGFYGGGFHTWYEIENGQWTHDEPLSQGQAMLAFARAIEAGKKRGLDTSRWETFLRKAAAFHSARILKPDWRPLSTNQAAFIAPLIKAHRLFGAPEFREAALKAARHYAARHLAMREPYWGGTLDAECEDKEGAAAAFQGFLELYEATHDPEHLKWARHACGVMLTYTVVWDIDLPPGRLRDHRLLTRGWTVVSPQNQHLDVWGAISAPEVYRLGQIDNREDLKRLALLMYRSCGQMIDARGSQGEQLHHTNYIQANQAFDPLKLRGGYNEQWTVFWITAHFLTGAARFAELGVPVWAE